MDYDEIDVYARRFGLDRRADRNLAGMRPPKLRKQQAQIPAEILSQVEGEDQFVPSFTSADSEQLMLREALTSFYQDNVISDVLARVKGGKEANVYCCAAHPATGMDLIAAKIYRPRIHRTMRNDAVYKEGRLMLDEQGKGVVRDARLKRAVARKTDFGKEVMTFSWIEYEYDLLQTLYDAGADVPRPIGHVDSTILMAYFGEVNRPAPTLNGVTLRREQAQPMFDRLLWHVELMLSHNRVHGDLSAYNVLYWQERAIVIDFPQAVVATSNPHAPRLLQRDIERLCQYFARYGVEADSRSLARGLWSRFERGEL
jgi:RIO kinase 1